MTALVTRKVLEAVLSSHRVNPRLDARSFAIDYMRRKAFSKYTGGLAPSQTSVDAALSKFLTTAQRVHEHRIEPQCFLAEELLKRFVFRSRNFFSSIDIDAFSPSSLHQRGGVGPGASIGTKDTDFLRKLYFGPVSATSTDVLHSYLTGCRTNPTDLIAAKCGLEKFGWYRANSSRISFVAKNVDEARTIATEPSLNMFFQLAIGNVINDHLKKVYGFSVSTTPEVNRAAAYEGSVTGKLATIDLQSASDSVSTRLCEIALPGFLMELLELYRCQYSRLPDGRTLRLPMVSTMGNGWTFSLMTALLYCALHAVCDVVGLHTDIKKCSVFGDDIVVPVKLYGATITILDTLGFVVNREKSFSEGLFRESCGHDFYAGTFVRPVYIKTMDSQSSLYVAFNRLAEWGSFHNVRLDLPLSLIRDEMKDVIFVPKHSDYASGIRVCSTLAPKMLTSGLWRYKRYEAEPLTYDVATEARRPRTLSPDINPSGVEAALLGGYLRNGQISERSKDKVRWKLVRRLTPNWDFRESVPCPGWGAEAEHRFDAVVSRVLCS